MRIAGRHLGIGQTAQGCVISTSGATCSPSSGSTLTVPQTPGATNPNNVLTPPLPAGYENTLPTGVIPENDIGQTNSNLAGTNETLCAQQGGTWNSTTNTCNMCPQNAFAALFMPQTWDPDSGACSSSYTPLILAGGGIAVLVLLISLMSRK
jgi:hypothetical protein